MNETLSRLVRREDGQDLIEYGMLAACVALLVATLLGGLLGGAVDAMFARAAAVF